MYGVLKIELYIIAREVQLDALPYVDQGYEEPGVREAESEEMEENRVRDVLTYCTSAFTLCKVGAGVPGHCH